MPALDDILGPGKSLSEYFKRYDFDGNGTLNSAEEAHQLTTNLIYVIESGGRRDELLEDRLKQATALVNEENWEPDSQPPKDEKWYGEWFEKTFVKQPEPSPEHPEPSPEHLQLQVRDEQGASATVSVAEKKENFSPQQVKPDNKENVMRATKSAVRDRALKSAIQDLQDVTSYARAKLSDWHEDAYGRIRRSKGLQEFLEDEPQLLPEEFNKTFQKQFHSVLDEDCIEKMKDVLEKEAGSGRGMNNLGLCYERGDRGVAKDMSKAVECYKKAAEAGDSDAMNNLGSCYEGGIGVAKGETQEAKEAKAIEWYTEAAAAGNSDAMYNLGVCYSKAKDVAKAKEWFTKAEKAGNSHAEGGWAKLRARVHDGSFGQLNTKAQRTAGITPDKQTDLTTQEIKRLQRNKNNMNLVNEKQLKALSLGMITHISKIIVEQQSSADAHREELEHLDWDLQTAIKKDEFDKCTELQSKIQEKKQTLERQTYRCNLKVSEAAQSPEAKALLEQEIDSIVRGSVTNFKRERFQKLKDLEQQSVYARQMLQYEECKRLKGKMDGLEADVSGISLDLQEAKQWFIECFIEPHFDVTWNHRLWELGCVMESVPVRFFIIMHVIANAVVLSFEADEKITDGNTMLALHAFFTCIFNLELALKMLAFGFWIFMDDFYNQLDFVIIVASDAVDILTAIELIHTSASLGNYILLGRSVRSFRLARLTHMLSDLEAIINSFFDAIKNVFWALGLALLFVMSCAIVTTSWFGNESAMDATRRQRLWGSTPNSMYTLFQIMTGEWAEITSETGDAIAGAYTFLLTFYVFCGMGVMALFNAIFVDSLQSAKLEHERDAERRRDVAKQGIRDDLKMLLHAADGALEDDADANFKDGKCTPEECKIVMTLLQSENDNDAEDDADPFTTARGAELTADESMQRFREEIEAKGKVLDIDLPDIIAAIELRCETMIHNNESEMDFDEVLEDVFSMEKPADKLDLHLVLKNINNKLKQTEKDVLDKMKEQQRQHQNDMKSLNNKLDSILEKLSLAIPAMGAVSSPSSEGPP